MLKYEIGQKIYFAGDMCNNNGWFIIINAQITKYGKEYDLKEIDGENREINAIMENSISDIYNGDYSKKFVTENAYNSNN